MQAIRDTERIRVERRQARLLTAAGLVLLLGALIASNVLTGLPPEAMTVWIIASYGALLVGFLCFNAGLKGIAKWSRRPRRDDIIDNHLRRLNDRFSVFHYSTLGGKLYDHVVVHPGGVTVLIPRDNFGSVRYENGRWRRDAKLLARIFNFAGPAIGNPHAEAATATHTLQEYLHNEGLVVEVDAVIVFVNPRVTLTVDESAIPIVRVEDLAGLLRERSTSNQLSGGQRLQVTRLIAAGIQKPDETPAPAGRRRTPPERRGMKPRGPG